MISHFKHWLFANYGWLACIAFITVIVLWMLNLGNLDWRAYVTAIASILSSSFLVQKQKLDEARLFKELFTEFNARYDGLNEAVNLIANSLETKPLSASEIETLFDYFNLCGEEYLMYRKGYIYPEVWWSWFAGMQIYLRNSKVRKLWEGETKTNSYYGLQV